MDRIKDFVMLAVLLLVLGVGFIPAYLYKRYSGEWPEWYDIIHFQ